MFENYQWRLCLSQHFHWNVLSWYLVQAVSKLLVAMLHEQVLISLDRLSVIFAYWVTLFSLPTQQDQKHFHSHSCVTCLCLLAGLSHWVPHQRYNILQFLITLVDGLVNQLWLRPSCGCSQYVSSVNTGLCPRTIHSRCIAHIGVMQPAGRFTRFPAA